MSLVFFFFFNFILINRTLDPSLLWPFVTTQSCLLDILLYRHFPIDLIDTYMCHLSVTLLCICISYCTCNDVSIYPKWISFIHIWLSEFIYYRTGGLYVYVCTWKSAAFTSKTNQPVECGGGRGTLICICHVSINAEQCIIEIMIIRMI